MTSVEELRAEYAWRDGHIRRDEWVYSGNTPGEPSVVAEFQAPRPLILKEDEPLEFVIPAHETFTTDGTGGNQENFSLSHNAIDSPSTTSFVLFDDGARVKPDAVDFAADSFDYTSPNTGTTLDAYYVPRDPAAVRFRKVSPKGSVRQDVEEFPTVLAHTRDQSKDPLEFDLDRTPLQPVIPRKYDLQLIVDAPYPVDFEEDARGTEATNALLELPRLQTETKIDGLGGAVKADALEM